tara:strand:+ start:1553 stop:2254 length:702 start_codon:yes stop_codon:yes gene_type:complete
MRRYKFTNVFRELDTGTVTLRGMIRPSASAGDVIFNVAWYRMFNRASNAVDVGFVDSWDELREKMIDKAIKRDQRVFTACHMHNGDVFLNLRSLKYIFRERFALANAFRDHRSLEQASYALCEFTCIGPFIAYEIATDLRFELENFKWKDTCTWSNVGPGSKRGLQRVGMQPTIGSMIELLEDAPTYLPLERWESQSHVPFELREIEHSLCEFDKYERVRLGEGRPKERYDGA